MDPVLESGKLAAAACQEGSTKADLGPLVSGG